VSVTSYYLDQFFWNEFNDIFAGRKIENMFKIITTVKNIEPSRDSNTEL